MIVNLYNEMQEDVLLKYAVIVATYESKWVFCRHKDRTTYEIPGGRREQGEEILETAKRELYEETGAVEFQVEYLCDYSVKIKNELNYGRVYFAKITKLGSLPDSEINEVLIKEKLPDHWTYPEIQPKFIQYYLENIKR